MTTSTTSKKKELIDFLWEWADGTEEWKKLLVNNIVSHERELTDVERKQVFDYFLQSIKIKSGLPDLKIAKPKYSPSSKQIELAKLSEVKGVNRLAEGQEINFSKNLTVIFGENGTGKTGYGRILKALGFSYEADTKIYPNIYKTPQNQSAKIDFKKNGISATFAWTGKNRNVDLASISVFNSGCVQISLNESRELIVSPIGFHLFNLISAELNRLLHMLDDSIRKHTPQLFWTENLNDGTPQKRFMDGLSPKTTENDLKKVSEFTAEHAEQLKASEKELKDLNKTLLAKEIKELNNYITELEENVSLIEDAKENFTRKDLEDVRKLNAELNKLKAKEQTSLGEIAKSNGLKLYDSDEFQEFIRTAEEYIQLLGDTKYPDGKIDTCVYCQQELTNKKAKDLLRNYRKILNDDTQEKIKETKEAKGDIIERVSEITTKISFDHPVFGENEEENPIQPAEIVEYNKMVKALVTGISASVIDEKLVFDLKYATYIDLLNKKAEALEKKVTAKRKSLENIEKEEEKVKTVINELKDRKLLLSRITEINKAISDYGIYSILNKHRGSFNTMSISKKTSDARDELVAGNFNSFFKSELRSLNKSDIDIQLDFGTTKGKSQVHQKLASSYNLIDILSEGEQKAIALAEFLTELQLENSMAPVIFDDPVNSLDHNIIDAVAKRLTTLSEKRQVVIFTHSILLFYSLLGEKENAAKLRKNIDFAFYGVRTDYGQSGILSNAEEVNSYNYYEGEINKIIKNPDKSRKEGDVASDGYGHLRSAIELTVEGRVFQDSVKRYKKNIGFGGLLKVNGKLIDENKEKINNIFERCCKYIKGHSHPTESVETPTLKGLHTDFSELIVIRSLFKN